MVTDVCSTLVFVAHSLLRSLFLHYSLFPTLSQPSFYAFLLSFHAFIPSFLSKSPHTFPISFCIETFLPSLPNSFLSCLSFPSFTPSFISSFPHSFIHLHFFTLNLPSPLSSLIQSSPYLPRVFSTSSRILLSSFTYFVSPFMFPSTLKPAFLICLLFFLHPSHSPFQTFTP